MEYIYVMFPNGMSHKQRNIYIGEYYFDDYFEEVLYMYKKKVIYNYNIEQSNQLIKKGMFPIGCGINPKSGGFFLVFSGTKGYYNTLDLIALENKQKEQIQE